MEKSLVRPGSTHSHDKVQHTVKFGSIFAPDSLRGINLLFRSRTDYNSLLINKPDKKILVKQSYIFMVWVNYLHNQRSNPDKEDITTKNPAFFIYPKRNYKTTITKAPMAHKTHSQEQFMVRFYSFSITFYSSYVDSRYRMLNSVDKAGYFASFLRGAVPFVGTNMLFVSKYNLVFHSRDILFFSLVNFNKLSSGPNHI